jgi:hypothetical protein
MMDGITMVECWECEKGERECVREGEKERERNATGRGSKRAKE